MSYRLLDKFRDTFARNEYRPRRSNLGEAIARELFEDLVELGEHASPVFLERVAEQTSVANLQNRRRGVGARRGDGMFGERVPTSRAVIDDGFGVARGQVATAEIGIEVKILATAMLKQVGRVISDLEKQTEHFRRGNEHPICIGIVGVNFAAQFRSVIGDNVTVTDGRQYRHPADEAPTVEQRLIAQAGPQFDEFLVLRFRATNFEPYPFEWVDATGTEHDYAAALVRISRLYDQRFPR